MKKLLILAFVFIANTSNAQWESKNSVDEFGEETNRKHKTLIAEGTFSNTATQHSEALFYFADKGDVMLINVYEYKSSLATNTEDTFELVKVRKKGGDTSYLEGVFFSKGGALYFNDRLYKQLKNAIKETGDYIILFDRTSKYSNSKYRINFSIVNDDDPKEVQDGLVFNPKPLKIKIHNSFLNEIKASAKYSTKKAKEENVEVEFYGDSELKIFMMSFKNYSGIPPKKIKNSLFEEIKLHLPIGEFINVKAFITDNKILIRDKDYDFLVKYLNYIGKYKLELKSKKLKHSYTVEFNL
jgi:hypothetical protein